MLCTSIFDNYIFTIQFWTVNLSPFIILTTVLDVHLILHDYIFHYPIFSNQLVTANNISVATCVDRMIYCRNFLRKTARQKTL